MNNTSKQVHKDAKIPCLLARTWVQKTTRTWSRGKVNVEWVSAVWTLLVFISWYEIRRDLKCWYIALTKFSSAWLPCLCMFLRANPRHIWEIFGEFFICFELYFPPNFKLANTVNRHKENFIDSGTNVINFETTFHGNPFVQKQCCFFVKVGLVISIVIHY